jgi:hypothetical protein
MPELKNAFGDEFPESLIGRPVRITAFLVRYGGQLPKWKRRLEFLLTDPSQVRLSEADKP